MNTRTLAVIAALGIAPVVSAQKAPDLAPYLTANRDDEVALARTAAPSKVSGSATVLVLTPKGYVEAAHGTNGFTCLVMRSFAGEPTDPAFWNPHTVAPVCFNPPAARTVLQSSLTKMQWAIAGATPAQMKERTDMAYADKRFPMPAAGAMAYMLSPRQHLSDDGDPHWMPHLMFYYDGSLSTAAFGAGDDSAPIVGGDGASKVHVQLIYIPVRAWSDGTPAIHGTDGK